MKIGAITTSPDKKIYLKRQVRNRISKNSSKRPNLMTFSEIHNMNQKQRMCRVVDLGAVQVLWEPLTTLSLTIQQAKTLSQNRKSNKPRIVTIKSRDMNGMKRSRNRRRKQSRVKRGLSKKTGNVWSSGLATLSRTTFEFCFAPCRMCYGKVTDGLASPWTN